MIEHRRQAEDKTGEVVDTEAHIANLAELRDRLRSMLASRPGNIKDVLEVERELAERQSKRDSMRGVRTALANRTEKVAMSIQFQTRSSISEQRVFASAASAWHAAGRAVMRSVGGMIGFVAAVAPWLVFLIPRVWGKCAARRRRTCRARSAWFWGVASGACRCHVCTLTLSACPYRPGWRSGQS